MTSPETDAVPIPKLVEPINLITGVFLKSVHFLDPDLTKCIVSGIFKNRDNSLGVLIKGRKGVVFWSYDSFCQLIDRFNEVTLAFLGNYQYVVTVDTGDLIKVNSIFGQQYACVSDGEHSLALNRNEWDQLVKFIPLIGRSLLELFYLEDIIKVFINQVLADTETCTEQLPPHVADRLFGEVSLWKL